MSPDSTIIIAGQYGTEKSVAKDPASGITNDANRWATETMSNARYPLELFLRVITVSLVTNRIVAGLPMLEVITRS